MDKYTQRRWSCQFRRCRRQAAAAQDLSFTQLLPKEQVEAALERHQVRYRERLYAPRLTIWTFLYQVLAPDSPVGRPWHGSWPSCALAAAAGVCPRDLSFKGTLQTLVAFAAAGWSCPERRNELYAAVLRAVATHRVNDRPDRAEPQAVKRRPKKQVYLTEASTHRQGASTQCDMVLWKRHSNLHPFLGHAFPKLVKPRCWVHEVGATFRICYPRYGLG